MSSPKDLKKTKLGQDWFHRRQWIGWNMLLIRDLGIECFQENTRGASLALDVR